MAAKELLSMILSYEDDIEFAYNDYCIGNISKLVYQKKQKKIIKKQIELIEQFKNQTLSKL